MLILAKQKQKVQETVISILNPEASTLLNKRLLAQDDKGDLKPSIRAFFNAMMFCYITGRSFKKAIENEVLLKIICVGEYCITLMYLDNHLQDEKYGLRKLDPETIRKNREEYEMLKAELIRFIDYEFEGEIKKAVYDTVHAILGIYDEGMKLDRHILTINNLARDNDERFDLINGKINQQVSVQDFVDALFLNPSSKYQSIPHLNYLNGYLTRSYLINAVFFEKFTKLMIKLFAPQGKDFSHLMQFARLYGVAQQLVNDNCDFVPADQGLTTSCKLVEDTFNDMRRGLVTLPLHLYFTLYGGNKGEIYDQYIYAGTPLNLWAVEDQKRVLNTLKTSGALGHSMHLVSRIGRKGRGLLDPQNPATPSLQAMFSFVDHNKFYHAYNQ